MPASKRNEHLRGRRGCLIWFFWLIVLGGIALAGYQYRSIVVASVDQMVMCIQLGTCTPDPVSPPDYAALVQDFRRGERAAVRNALEPTITDVMGAVAVYTTGSALQQVQDKVSVLQTASRWQEITLEQLDNIQAVSDTDEKIKLLTEEVYRTRTYERRSGVDTLVLDEHFQIGSVYVLEFLDGKWIITDIATTNNRVDLPN